MILTINTESRKESIELKRKQTNEAQPIRITEIEITQEGHHNKKLGDLILYEGDKVISRDEINIQVFQELLIQQGYSFIDSYVGESMFSLCVVRDSKFGHSFILEVDRDTFINKKVSDTRPFITHLETCNHFENII